MYHAFAPKVEVLSTIGAGDSTIAGFLSAMFDGLASKETLARAVAYGSAACQREGTAPPRKEDVLSLVSKIAVNAV